MAAYIIVLYCVYVLSCVADDADCRLQRLSAIVLKIHYYYYYIGFAFRLHRMHEMQTIVTDDRGV